MTMILEKNMGYAEFPLAYPMRRNVSVWSRSPVRGLIATIPTSGNIGRLLLRPCVELIAVCLILEGPRHHEHVGGKPSCGSRHQEEPLSRACSRRSWILRGLDLLQDFRGKVGFLDRDVVGLLSERGNHAHHEYQNERYDNPLSHRILLSRNGLITSRHHAQTSIEYSIYIHISQGGGNFPPLD